VRDKQREETRRRLYLAALEVFRRDGMQNCRIDDIAQRAEVSRAAFYFHFPTKEAVVVELIRESEKPIAEALLALDPKAPILTVLETLAVEMAKSWQNEAGLLVAMATVGLTMNANHLQDREYQPVRDFLAKRFTAASERGELSPVLPPEVLSDFFLVNCLAAMVAWVGAPMLPLEVVLRGVGQLFLSGAGMPVAPAPSVPAPAAKEKSKR
jgi:AcrR family transcriptional regulator